MSRPVFTSTLLGVLLIAIVFVHASNCADARTVSKKERESAVSKLDDMYATFLTGDIATARQSLLSAIEYIQSNSTRMPELINGLPIGYARLSLLERRVGNEPEARIAYEKARYWRIIERERVKLPPKVILSEHDEFTREESDKLADEWDRRRTKGVGPAYAKQVTFVKELPLKEKNE